MRRTVSAGPVPPSALRAAFPYIPVRLNGYDIIIILCAMLGAFLYGEAVIYADDYDNNFQFEEVYVTVGNIQILHHNTIGLRCDRQLNAESGETSLLLSYPTLFASHDLYTSKLHFYRAPSGQVQDQDTRNELFSGTHDGLVWDDILYTVNVTVDQEGVYELYKEFEYDSSLPDGDGENLIVLIHGWNPYETENPYIDEGSEWKLLADAVTSYIQGSGWELFPYNWSSDAATGKIIGSLLKPADDGDGIKTNTLYGMGVSNGSQAAEIAWMHGYNHLGGYILEKRPSIANIHIIAHSAGSWMARAAAQYLDEHQPGISIQITFLDPYIPGEVGYKDFFGGIQIDEDSKLTLDKLQVIQNWNGVVKLDQYYTDGISDPYVLGTNSDIDWARKGYTKKIVSLYVAKAHEYPIEWYADTVTNALQVDDGGEPYGWTRSLAYDSITSVEDEPRAFHVSPPFPNPFNPATTIEYRLPTDCHVTITVFDILGRTVRVLLDESVQSGFHTVVWNGESETGSAVGNGVYLYQVNAGLYSSGGKMLLMK